MSALAAQELNVYEHVNANNVDMLSSDVLF